MLTVKEINDVSFGKAGFSGYKPEDVDRFIDEVAASFQELIDQRDEAQRRLQELTAQNAALSAKNAEMQQKLSVLAQKIETYRNEEDSIKEAIISAQKVKKDAIREAEQQAEAILEEARNNARQTVEEARRDNYKVIQGYAAQTEEKRGELEEMKRQVTAFRSSLMEMYKKHLECIDHIPVFKQKEAPQAPAPKEEPEPAPAPAPAAPEAPQPVPEEKPEPEPEPAPVNETVEPEPEPAPEPARPAPVKEPEDAGYRPLGEAPRARSAQEISRATLNDRVDYTQPEEDFPPEDDLTEVGIDIHTYSSIPESLQKEKKNHFSNLEFGDDVDLGNRRRRK